MTDESTEKIQTCCTWGLSFPNTGKLILNFKNVSKCPGIDGSNKDWPSDLNDTFILPHYCSHEPEESGYPTQLFRLFQESGWKIVASIDVNEDLHVYAYYDCPNCSYGRGMAFRARLPNTDCSQYLFTDLGGCGFLESTLWQDCISGPSYAYCEQTGYGGAVGWNWEP